MRVNMCTRYQELILVFAWADKLDPRIPLKNQCRKIEVLTSNTNIRLASKQLRFILIYYTRIIADLSLVIREIIISSQMLKCKNYINFTKLELKKHQIFSLNIHILHARVAGSSKISWMLLTYSSVRVHFYSRNNITTFHLAQHLKFCYHLERI